MQKCRESNEFGDVDETYYGCHGEWLENTVQQCIFNTRRMVDDYKLQPRGGASDAEELEFLEKMKWWQVAAKRISKGHMRGIKWKNDAVRAAFSRDSGSLITWVSSQAKVIPLGGFDREGGYGKVRKVHIQGVDTIPHNLPLAGKVAKGEKKRDMRVQRSVEALACPLNHPAIIKFIGIHADTMEAYSFWWNGGNLLDLRKLNDKVVPGADWFDIYRVKELTAEQQQKVSLFRRHKAKLAWALVYVTHLMHQTKVLHNDLSPMNIMFHFPEYTKDVINIGICDWGISSRLDEEAPSHYGYRSEEEKQERMQRVWWVAPELFYTFGPQNSETSLDIMQATHKYTRHSDSYSIGKLVEWMDIWNMAEHDKDLFQDRTAHMYFAMKLGDLTKQDVKERSTCSQITHLLMGKPWNMKPPEVVFRHSEY